MGEFWEDNLILRVLAGSRAQGLAGEGSDTDTRGVCIPPARYLIGLSAFELAELRLRDRGAPSSWNTSYAKPVNRQANRFAGSVSTPFKR